jgi:hypothetical protein
MIPRDGVCGTEERLVLRPCRELIKELRSIDDSGVAAGV